MRKYHTTLIAKKRVAKDTIEVSFSRPNDFQFQAGQYVQLGLPHLLFPDSAGSSRVMSIASSPLSDKEIAIAFRDTGTGYKDTFKHLKIGAPAIIEGPYGFFTLSEHITLPRIFLAGGIGVTPFLSMLQYSTASNLDIPTTLLYSNSKLENAAYLSELQDLARHNRRFTLRHIVGRLDFQTLQQHLPDAENCLWYISGPPTMVASVRNSLSLLGVDDGRVCGEEFTGY